MFLCLPSRRHPLFLDALKDCPGIHRPVTFTLLQSYINFC